MLFAISLLTIAGIVFEVAERSSDPRGAPRYVFIDGGAHVGETIDEFIKSPLYSKHDWEMIAFEANPLVIEKIPKRDKLTIMNKAIWTDDDGVEFLLSRDELGSSIVETMASKNAEKRVRVDSIDFGHWLEDNFERSDVIYVKLDIEGAEYAVLEQMLRDGTIRLIDKLFIEFNSPIFGENEHLTKWTAKDRRRCSRMSAREHVDLCMRKILPAMERDARLVEAMNSFGVIVSLHFMVDKQGTYFRFDPEQYGLAW